VPGARRASRSMRDRLHLALDLLHDPAFDALVSGSWRFAELPSVMARLASAPGIFHTITYDEEPPCSA